jgi:3'-5' exoribonuclease
MTGEIEFLTSGISDKNIQKFVEDLLFKHEKEFLEVPSSSGFHHAYKGGNFEHTTNVMLIVQSSYNYKINLDIAIAGAILHDVGKIKCYSINKKRIVHTVRDVLHGHFLHGNRILEEAYNENPIIPKDQFDEIQHIILSHHGPVSQGHGSIVDPMTMEALLVSQVDQMDAYLSHIKESKVNLFCR